MRGGGMSEPVSSAGWQCECCGRPVPGFTPTYCCDGTECGCNGMPIEPCVCSEACYDAIMSNIGMSFEARRIAAGIERWEPSP